ncbi:unnamed protein product [Macrosiphum euphorbiae]|uniref:Uncharacterized protein n=1 Tax=Macrosiphum euphorbiae TaxID=13131 RepID=A0AAV0W7A2_9HEMI|nr:unnamed protein product [Macrosiphum euphorbiae]
MAVWTNSAKVTEFGWKSMPYNLPAVDNTQESKQKPSEIGDFPSLLVHKRAVSCPNMVLLKNSAAEALLETWCKSTRYQYNTDGYLRYPGKWTETFGKLRFP